LVRIQRDVNAIKTLGASIVTVNIHSLGGDANHALAIYDALKEHSAKIITKISGMCASAATVIFMAGNERKMSENALMLVHKCWRLVIANENESGADSDNFFRTIRSKNKKKYHSY
jgi:ATP-dependent protease ClpP protease subunit